MLDLIGYIAIVVFGFGLTAFGTWVLNRLFGNPNDFFSGMNEMDMLIMGALCVGSGIILIAGGTIRAIMLIQAKMKNKKPAN